jgi:hypothetical protein
VDNSNLHIGAAAFIHRFGSSLNGHVHFHVCVVDVVFEQVVGDADAQSSPSGAVFHPASGIDTDAVTQVQTNLRRRILRAFMGRGLIEKAHVKDMLGYQYNWFSVDAGVRIEAHNRAALERLVGHCARPLFAMDRLRNQGAALLYRCAKQHSEPGSNERGAQGRRTAPHSAGSDRPQCGPGATATHAPALGSPLGDDCGDAHMDKGA